MIYETAWQIGVSHGRDTPSVSDIEYARKWLTNHNQNRINMGLKPVGLSNEDYIYDIETYPNVFTLYVIRVSDNSRWLFEISDRKNQSQELKAFLDSLHTNPSRMVGYNNVGFDYPIIHEFLAVMRGYPECNAYTLYLKCQSIINAQNNDRFSNMVWESDWYVPQLDLFKIHHFDNVARSTSLKMLEFVMRSDNIQDLPFPPGTTLTSEQIDELIKYNAHDVEQTLKFYNESTDQIRFREELSEKYNRNFINHNDTKIGKDYFIMRLEESGVPCYTFSPKKPIQTIRPIIHLKDVILPYIHFDNPEFNRIHQWFLQQSITETKGVFKDLTATVGGMNYDFGVGGIHGAIPNRKYYSDDEYAIEMRDVTSYYPSMAIVNRWFPEHMGETFCDIYQDMFNQRRSYAKGTSENAMLKLALNGTYGDSNNKYSPFYDPQFTMSITVNGQLLLCMLCEKLLTVPDLEMINVNTDGVGFKYPRMYRWYVDHVCDQWQKLTGLGLETDEYSMFFQRDVNSYIGVEA